MPKKPTPERGLEVQSPIVVKPRVARVMLQCGNEKIYRLLNDGLLDSFTDGRARYITTDSIHRYVAQRLANSGGAPSSTPAAAPPHRRGRPRKGPPL